MGGRLKLVDRTTLVFQYRERTEEPTYDIEGRASACLTAMSL